MIEGLKAADAADAERPAKLRRHMVTLQQIEDARTPSGGYTRKQLTRWGVPWPPPKGWKDVLLAGGYRAPGKKRGGDEPSAERG